MDIAITINSSDVSLIELLFRFFFLLTSITFHTIAFKMLTAPFFEKNYEGFPVRIDIFTVSSLLLISYSLAFLAFRAES